MVMNPSPVICEGVLDKKSDRVLLGSGWKSRYCNLTSDALVMYRNKGKCTTKGRPIRTLPLCHLKSVKSHPTDPTMKFTIFEIGTEQGESLIFRCKDNVGWAAQIQIQLIHYKNRQDILRYKQLNSSMSVAENVIQRQQNYTGCEQRVMDPKIVRRICPNRGYKTVVLPNHKHSEMGIGITVIADEGRIVVNRVLEGGPAARLGVLKSQDELVLVNSVPVKSVENLLNVVKSSPDAITFVVKPFVPKPHSPKDEIEYKNEMKKYINYEARADNEDSVFKFL